MRSLSYSIKYEEAECWTLRSPHSINFNPVGIVVRHSAYSLYISMKNRLHVGIFEVQKKKCVGLIGHILTYSIIKLTLQRKGVSVCTYH